MKLIMKYMKDLGFYKSTLLADHVQSKIITIFPKEELSLQKHKRREEHWIIIKGEGKNNLRRFYFSCGAR